MGQSQSRFTRFSGVVLLGVVLCLIAPALLQAQTSTGIIVGVIRDPSGAVVPGAQVTVTNQGTNVSFRYTTGGTGDYYVPSLIPGQYRVEVEKPGFKKVTVSDVLVEVDRTSRVDINLEVGQVTEEVQVSVPPPQVQTDTTTLGQVIGSRQVSELPLNGRDFTNLLFLNTGVGQMQGGIITGIRQHGLNDNFRTGSVNGARPASISFVVDGVSMNDSLFQGISVVPPIDALEEFKLQNGLYSAEFGMGAAQVNIALKSGTNSFHGSLWEFLRNNALQPAQPFFHTKTPLKQNQFGGTLGGPIWIPKIYKGKDRTFFFVSYEAGRRRSGSIGSAQDEAASAEDTDWPQILALYELLERMSDNPMVTLNHAIAAAMVHGPSKGLELLSVLDSDTRIAGQHRLDAVRAHLLEMAGDHKSAITHYQIAAGRTASIPERNYLMTQAARLRESTLKPRSDDFRC